MQSSRNGTMTKSTRRSVPRSCHTLAIQSADHPARAHRTNRAQIGKQYVQLGRNSDRKAGICPLGSQHFRVLQEFRAPGEHHFGRLGEAGIQNPAYVAGVVTVEEISRSTGVAGDHCVPSTPLHDARRSQAHAATPCEPFAYGGWMKNSTAITSGASTTG